MAKTSIALAELVEKGAQDDIVRELAEINDAHGSR